MLVPFRFASLLVALAVGIAPAIPAVGSELRLPELRVIELANGVRLYVGEEHTAPTVTIAVALPAGHEHEAAGGRHVASVTAAASCGGIPGMDGTEIWMELQRLGGEIRGWSDFDGTYFSMNSLSATWEDVLTVLGSCIRTPTFPEKDFQRIRGQLVNDEKGQWRDPAHIASVHLLDLLYEGPLGEPFTVESLERVSREDVIAFHRTYYQPNRAVVVALGDFAAGDAEAALRGAFADWPRGAEPPPPPPSRPRDSRPRARLVHKPGLTQATIRCGQSAPAGVDPDRFAFRIACDVLGSGWGSRLMTKVRSEGGKTYDISCSHQIQHEFGQCVVSTFTRNAEVGAVIDTVGAVLRKFARDGMTPDELETARRMRLGFFVIGLEDPGQVAGALARHLAQGISLDEFQALPSRYEAVALEEANRLAGDEIRPEELAWVVVGDKNEVGRAVRRLGRVETLDYREPIHPGSFFRRAEYGLGFTWNTAASGVRASVLYRWFGLSGLYGFARDDPPWSYDSAAQASVDVHRGSSEYSSASLYLGVTGTFTERVRGVSPHLGLRIFPFWFGLSTFFEAGGSFWDGASDLPDFYTSFGIDLFP